MTAKDSPLGLTIDAQGSRDLDDAIWADEIDGGYLISIIVVDVASHVKRGSHDDNIAMERGTNVYTNGIRTTMFGEHITSSLSLIPNQLRDVVVIQAKVDYDGNISNEDVFQCKFKSLSKLTYEKVENIIRDSTSRLNPIMISCARVASLLWTKRVNNVSVPDDWNSAFDLDGNVSQNIQVGELAQSIVHEFMIVANNIATNFLVSKELDMIYRNQVPRPGERSGRYEVVPRGHFGLGVETYGQFTSPMRRYVDLVNQRILISAINHKPSPYNVLSLSPICATANLTFQKADMASKVLNGVFVPPIAQGLHSIKRMDSFAFSRLLSRCQHFDKRLWNEYIRRRDFGLLNIVDIGKLLFSEYSPLNMYHKSYLLGMISNTKAMAPRIWQVASERGLVQKYESDIYQKKDGTYKSFIHSGRFIGEAEDDDYDKVRDKAICEIMSKVLNVDIFDVSQKLELTTLRAHAKLETLCKEIGWPEPEFVIEKISSNKNKNIKNSCYQGYVKVMTDTYQFVSPIVFSSTQKGIKFSASEIALSNLKPYAREIYKRDCELYGIDMSILYNRSEEHSVWDVLHEFCDKYGLTYKVMWNREYQFPEFASCVIELKHGNSVLQELGEGENRAIAKQQASQKIINLLTGKNDMDYDTTLSR